MPEPAAALLVHFGARGDATDDPSHGRQEGRFFHGYYDNYRYLPLYVFAGDEDRPYAEEDATDPRSVYGKSKRAGEIAVLGTHGGALVVRTSWVFGPGRNFVVAILDQAVATAGRRALNDS